MGIFLKQKILLEEQILSLRVDPIEKGKNEIGKLLLLKAYPFTLIVPSMVRNALCHYFGQEDLLSSQQSLPLNYGSSAVAVTLTAVAK